MPESAIFAVGLLATLLCSAFVLVSFRELQRLGQEADDREANR